MQRGRLCYAMHGKIACNVAALRAGLLHAAAFERELRKLCDVEKLRAAKVIVPLLYSRVDAAHLNPGRDGRALGVLAIKVDVAGKLSELAIGRAQKLMHPESDRGTSLIELIGFICGDALNERRENQSDAVESDELHVWFHFFSLLRGTSVFKRGNRTRVAGAKTTPVRDDRAQCKSQ